MKYRFVLENMAVVEIIPNDGGLTFTLKDVIVCTIADAKAMMPLIGLNIDMVYEFEMN